MATTLDPSFKGSNGVLSNGDLTFTGEGSYSSCLSTTSKTLTDKVYFEVTANLVASFVGIGFGNHSLAGNLDIWLGHSSHDQDAFAYFNDGAIYMDGSAVISGQATFDDADVIGVAYDGPAGIATFYVNGTPLAQTFDFAANSYNQPAYVGITVQSNADQATVNFGATAFAYPVPSGFIPWDGVGGPTAAQNLEWDLAAGEAPTTFDPDNTGSNINLTNGNLTFDAIGGSFGCTLSTSGKLTGKWYFEYTADNTTGDSGIGVGDINTDLENYGGIDDHSAILFKSGNLWQSNISQVPGATPAWSNGDIIGLAIDVDAGTIDVYLNNTFGASYNYNQGAFATPVYICGTATSAGQGTGNFGNQALTYTPPTGYVPWDTIIESIEAGQSAEWTLGAGTEAAQDVEWRLIIDANAGQTVDYYLLLRELGQTAEWSLTAPKFAGQTSEWDLDAQVEAAQILQWNLSSAQETAAQNLQWELKILSPVAQTMEWLLPESVQLPQTGDLRFSYSGGTENLDPLQSIGGARSTRELVGQDIADTTPLDGIEIVYAARNDTGAGTLEYVAAGPSVAWQGANQQQGEFAILAADGEYTIHDNHGYLVINVDVNSLSEIDLTADVGIRQPKQSLFPNILPDEAVAGFADYLCIYLYNGNPDTTLFDLSIYIASQSDGPDLIALGIDPAGVGDGVNTGVATVVLNRYTAPAGVSFSQPDSGNPLAIGDLGPGESAAIWLQRSISSNISIYYPYVSFELGVFIN